jgi:hypothetical protein
MKAWTQSHQFPEHMSNYWKAKEDRDFSLMVINEDTNESIFHRRIF